MCKSVVACNELTPKEVAGLDIIAKHKKSMIQEKWSCSITKRFKYQTKQAFISH